MTVKIHPQGGFSFEKSWWNADASEPVYVRTRLTWEGRGVAVEVEDPRHTPAVVTLLTDALGDGLKVEFDQGLLRESNHAATVRRDGTPVVTGNAGIIAEHHHAMQVALGLRMEIEKIAGKFGIKGQAPVEEVVAAINQAIDNGGSPTDGRLHTLSCDIVNIATKLGIDVPVESVHDYNAVQHVLLQIGEQVTGALSSELKTTTNDFRNSTFTIEQKFAQGFEPDIVMTAVTKDAEKLASRTATSPFGPGPSDPPPAIAGTPVAEAQPGEQKTPRKRRTREQIEADNAAAEAAKKPQPTPAPQVPVQPTAPNPAATADFKAEMSSIEQRQAEVSPPSPLKPPAETIDKDAPADQLDEFTLLLSKPAMPPDMHPLDLRRPGETRFADTAYVRLFFGRCLGPEYQADPDFKARSKFEVPPVSLNTDEGVVACVQLLWAIRERAVQRGSEIPQLEALFALGDAQDVAKIAIEKIRARRGATSRPAGQ